MPTPTIDQDELILRMLADDDDQAIRLLFDRYYPLLADVVLPLVHDGNAADDILQELFINLWMKRHHVQVRKPIVRYLLRSAINRARNYQRDRMRLKEILVENFFSFEKQTRSGAPDSGLHQHDLKRLWKCATQRMSHRARAVFILSRKKGMSNQEIAVWLGISVKGVEKNMTCALKVLRQVFTPYFHVVVVVASLL